MIIQRMKNFTSCTRYELLINVSSFAFEAFVSKLYPF